MATPRRLRAAGLFLIGGAVIATARWQTVQSPANWRAQFTQAALRLPFDTERGPALDDGVSPEVHLDSMPKMTIAAALRPDTGKLGRVDLRITSAGPYPRLGIAPGLNYVWKDVVDGKMRLLVIPADTSYGAKWLTMESHPHISSRKAPRLVITPLRNSTSKTLKATAMSYGFGICEGPCPNDRLVWCKSTETLRVKPPVFPDKAIQQYLGGIKGAGRGRAR